MEFKQWHSGLAVQMSQLLEDCPGWGTFEETGVGRDYLGNVIVTAEKPAANGSFEFIDPTRCLRYRFSGDKLLARQDFC